MVKHIFKILRFDHRKVVKVLHSFFSFMAGLIVTLLRILYDVVNLTMISTDVSVAINFATFFSRPM